MKFQLVLKPNLLSSYLKKRIVTRLKWKQLLLPNLGSNSLHQEAIYNCLFVLYQPAGTATFISKNADNEIQLMWHHRKLGQRCNGMFTLQRCRSRCIPMHHWPTICLCSSAKLFLERRVSMLAVLMSQGIRFSEKFQFLVFIGLVLWSIKCLFKIQSLILGQLFHSQVI